MKQEQGSHLIQHQDEGATGLRGAGSPLLHRILQEELSLAGLRRAEAEGQGLHLGGGEEGSSVQHHLRGGGRGEHQQSKGAQLLKILPQPPPKPCPNPDTLSRVGSESLQPHRQSWGCKRAASSARVGSGLVGIRAPLQQPSTSISRVSMMLCKRS